MSRPTSEAAAREGPAPDAPGAPATLVRNSAFMLAARVFSVVASAALTLYAVRALSVAEYGRYATALALTMLVGLLSELGITGLALREMTQRQEEERRILGVAVTAEVISSAVAAAVLVPLGLLLGYPSSVLLMLAIGAAFLLLAGPAAGLDTAFKARRVLVYSAIVAAVAAVATTAVGATALALDAGGPGLFLGLAVGQAAGLAVCIRLLRRIELWPDLHGALRRVRPFLRAAVPIAVAGSVTALYDRIDILMMSKLDGATGTAIYALPLTIQQAVLLAPMVIATAFFPVISRLVSTDARQAREPFLLVLRIFLVVSVPVALFLGIAGRPVLVLAFGDRYSASAGPLAVLAGTIVLGFLLYLFWYLLLAARRERRAAVVFAAALSLNVALNVVLIPADGARGAATALLASDAVMVGLLAVQTSRHVFSLREPGLALRPLAGLAAAAAVAVPLFGVSRSAAGAAAAAAYAGVLLGSRYVTAEEWRPLTGPLRDIWGRLRSRSA